MLSVAERMGRVLLCVQFLANVFWSVGVSVIESVFKVVLGLSQLGGILEGGPNTVA